MEEWKNLKELDDSYKNIINNYFENKTGSYLLKDNILHVNIDNWGLEKFYINGYTKNNKCRRGLFENGGFNMLWWNCY